VRAWRLGDWNTIPDYGSRSVVADPTEQLSEHEQLKTYIYALLAGCGR
jgi:hypothetical protein